MENNVYRFKRWYLVENCGIDYKVLLSRAEKLDLDHYYSIIPASKKLTEMLDCPEIWTQDLYMILNGGE